MYHESQTISGIVCMKTCTALLLLHSHTTANRNLPWFIRQCGVIEKYHRAFQLSRVHLIHSNVNTCTVGAPVAQWAKRWPTDLADRFRSPLEAKRSSIAHSSFISKLPSPCYDRNTVEKDEKLHVIHLYMYSRYDPRQ